MIGKSADEAQLWKKIPKKSRAMQNIALARAAQCRAEQRAALDEAKHLIRVAKYYKQVAAEWMSLLDNQGSPL